MWKYRTSEQWVLYLSPQICSVLKTLVVFVNFLKGKASVAISIINTSNSPQRLLLERALVCLERGVICTLPQRSGGHGTGLTGSEEKYCGEKRDYYLRKSMNGCWNISGRDTAVVGARCQEVCGPGLDCFVVFKAGASELHTSEEESAAQGRQRHRLSTFPRRAGASC